LVQQLLCRKTIIIVVTDVMEHSPTFLITYVDKIYTEILKKLSEIDIGF